MVVEYMGVAMRNSMADHMEKVYETGAFAGQGGDCYMFRLDPECARRNGARQRRALYQPLLHAKLLLKGHRRNRR